jgi:drug/metabolite transporter (DMT)-like permease
VVNNLSPLACVLLAFIFLKERLKPVEIIFLLLIAAGIIDIVLGASKKKKKMRKPSRKLPGSTSPCFVIHF